MFGCVSCVLSGPKFRNQVCPVHINYDRSRKDMPTAAKRPVPLGRSAGQGLPAEAQPRQPQPSQTNKELLLPRDNAYPGGQVLHALTTQMSSIRSKSLRQRHYLQRSPKPVLPL